MGNIRLNIQGLSRKSESLMSGFVAEVGKSFTSSDLSQGEPTAICHYSKDPMYYQASFGMVGKAPYYENDILLIDDIYLMSASFSPMGKDKLKEAFHTTWKGKTFQEQWLEDSEVVKNALKADIRNLHKISCLGLGYGMYPNKLMKTAYENGYIISKREAQGFFDQYWETFKGVARLRDMLAYKVRKQGFLINDFGYRLNPDKDSKGLNFYIQSTISGLMHLLTNMFYERSEAEFVTVIHDELISQVEDEKLDETKTIFYNCVDDLNKILRWSVPLRCGFKPGKNFYTAH